MVGLYAPFLRVCELCDYKCSKSSDLDRHLLTRKHLVREKDSKALPKSFVCACGKSYTFDSGYYRHKKKCTYIPALPSQKEYDENEEYKAMMVTIINENKELRKQVTELIPKVGTINSHNNINQKFNIQVFLNEKCKDALDFDDFIKSIKINVQQLDFTKNNGLEDGLSNIIIEKIKNMDLYERPLHCTDVKRDTLYIKNNNIWNKNNSKQEMKNAINNVSTKHYNALNLWMEENPDYAVNDLKQDYYAKTLSVIGKSTNAIDDKIIKKICNNTYIKDVKDNL